MPIGIKNYYIAIYIISIFAILWPLLTIFTSLNLQLSSSLPVFIAASILILLFSSNLKFKIFNLNTLLLLISCIFISIVSVVNGNVYDGFRTFKTFGTIIFFVLILKFYSCNYILLKKYVDFSFKLALAVSFWGLFELVIRFYFPGVGDYYYQILSAKNFSGVEYLSKGYLDFGAFFEGQKPLGLYGDMHTSPAVALLCICYFGIKRDNFLLFLSIISLLLTFRWTLILPLPFLVIAYFLKSNIKNKMFLISISLIFLVSAIFISINDYSGKIVFDQLNNFNVLIDVLDGNYFGYGYSGDLDVNPLIEEIFLYKIFFYFGIFSLFYFLFISKFFFDIYIKYCNCRMSENFLFYPFVLIFLIFLPIFGTIHYNHFFNVTILFLYSCLISFCGIFFNE